MTITINGAEDAPVIGGVSSGAVAEDGALTTSGTLSITDVDTNDNPISFPDEAATAGDNGYGSFELIGGTWTYTLDNANAAVQALDVGETLTDTHTFTASDGSTQLVTVTINGAEDAPVVSGTFTGAVNEGNVGDAPVTASGTISISDIDASDNPGFADTTVAGIFGSLSLTAGTWTYTLDQAAVQHLNAGDTASDVITLTASDGTTQAITVDTNGTNDAPVVGPGQSFTLSEDAPVGNAVGSVTATDPDSASALQNWQIVSGNSAGVFQINPGTGQITVADNTNLDYETTDTYVLQVQVSDGTVTSTAAHVTIQISDVSEGTAANNTPPVITVEVEPVPRPEPIQATEVTGPSPDGESAQVTEDTSDTDKNTESLATSGSGTAQPNTVSAEPTPAEGPTQAQPATDELPARGNKQHAEQPRYLDGLKVLIGLKTGENPAAAEILNQTTLSPMVQSLLSSEAFWNALDTVSEDLEEVEMNLSRYKHGQVEMVSTLAASLTAGFVAWTLKGGSLLANMMASAQLWMRFDPLPILSTDPSKLRPAPTPGSEKEPEAERLFSEETTRKPTGI